MIALDKTKQAFFPAYCRYADKKQPPKLFLVENAEGGLGKLKSEALEGSLTGAKVSDCNLISILRVWLNRFVRIEHRQLFLNDYNMLDWGNVLASLCIVPNNQIFPEVDYLYMSATLVV